MKIAALTLTAMLTSGALSAELRGSGSAIETTSGVENIVAHMIEHENARQATLGEYSWTSEYVLDNKDRHAEMLVRWMRHADGTKTFEILNEQGDSGVRGHVFHKLLESEVEASQPAFRERNRLAPENYSFRLTGAADRNGRLAYILEIEPKKDAKFLTRGRIWVDAADYAVIQVEGSPSKRPSFWTNNVAFVQTFEKTGDYWMASSNQSVTEAKMFGRVDMAIRHFDYKFSNRPAEVLASLSARTSH